MPAAEHEHCQRVETEHLQLRSRLLAKNMARGIRRLLAVSRFRTFVGSLPPCADVRSFDRFKGHFAASLCLPPAVS